MELRKRKVQAIVVMMSNLVKKGSTSSSLIEDIPSKPKFAETEKPLVSFATV